VQVDDQLLRTINNRLRRFGGNSDGAADFACECAGYGCMTTLHMALEEYDALRAKPGVLAVAPGHERKGANVVAYTDGYDLVRDSPAA
jgi:hypothetical protein